MNCDIEKLKEIRNKLSEVEHCAHRWHIDNKVVGMDICDYENLMADTIEVVDGVIEENKQIGFWKERKRHGGGIVEKTIKKTNEVSGEEEIVTGYVDERYTWMQPYCSNCGKGAEEKTPFCSNCGRKMDYGKTK